MSPSDIEVLIHYHCSPSVHPRHDAPAVSEAVERFIKDDILEPGGIGRFQTTSRGKALLQAICNTAYPTQAWIDESGKIIQFD